MPLCPWIASRRRPVLPFAILPARHPFASEHVDDIIVSLPAAVRSFIDDQRLLVGLGEIHPVEEGETLVRGVGHIDIGYAPTARLLDALAVALDPGPLAQFAFLRDRRSEASRVGKECVSTCRSRWSPYHNNKKHK